MITIPARLTRAVAGIALIHPFAPLMTVIPVPMTSAPTDSASMTRLSVMMVLPALLIPVTMVFAKLRLFARLMTATRAPLTIASTGNVSTTRLTVMTWMIARMTLA
jgi:hypothetical protein